MFSIRTCFIFLLCIISAYMMHLYHDNKRLKTENNQLIETQKTQLNIVEINDQYKENDKELSKKISDKIENVKNIKSGNDKDFIKKSQCIFANFGTDYIC